MEAQFVLKVDLPGTVVRRDTVVLYDLLLEVTAEDEQLKELIPQRVRFRRQDEDHIMMLNGKRVSLKASTPRVQLVSGRRVFREKS